MKIGRFELTDVVDTTEPMHCMRDGCEEELNGLHKFTLHITEDMEMEIWLCGKCDEKFMKEVNGGKNDSNT